MEISDEMLDLAITTYDDAPDTALGDEAMRSALEAVAPLIRAAALEEAAKVCDVTPLSDECAKSIRALATQEG